MAATTWEHKFTYPTTAGNLRICWVSDCASLDPAAASGRSRQPSAADHKLLEVFRDMPVTCGDLGGSGLVSVRYLLTCP